MLTQSRSVALGIKTYKKVDPEPPGRFDIILQLKILPNFPPVCVGSRTPTATAGFRKAGVCLTLGFQRVRQTAKKDFFLMKKKHDKPSTVTVDASCSLQEPPATFYVPSLKLDLCTKSETGLTGWEKMGLKSDRPKDKSLNSMEIRLHKIVSWLPTLKCPGNSKPDWRVPENKSPDRPPGDNPYRNTPLCSGWLCNGPQSFRLFASYSISIDYRYRAMKQ